MIFEWADLFRRQRDINYHDTVARIGTLAIASSVQVLLNLSRQAG